MNKRISKKIVKGKFWYHHGQMLWQYHAYQADPRTREVLLCYDLVDGCELYFKTWAKAKHYLRRTNGHGVKKYSPYNVDLISCDDIPF